jgi:hypothetical protein
MIFASGVSLFCPAELKCGFPCALNAGPRVRMPSADVH